MTKLNKKKLGATRQKDQTKDAFWFETPDALKLFGHREERGIDESILRGEMLSFTFVAGFDG